MNKDAVYDIAITGGGLAGLSLSIQAAKKGYRVILLEKEKYPFHKVCGEYISLESWDFMEELGLPLSEMNLPVIRKLLVSAPNGRTLEHMLPLGGFGISRYTLDALLAAIAVKNGVTVKENTKVQQITFDKGSFTLDYPGHSVNARLAIGSFGKRSNIDTSWQRGFIQRKPDKLNNYVGIKYHVQYDFPEDTIALHNFKDGYCGLSRVDGDKYCLCYMTTAHNLRSSENDIKKMENRILSRNPHLANIFNSAKFLGDEPSVISQISFSQKTQVENHVLMVGDAAGMITPLCGNGMSMAMHASKLAFAVAGDYLEGILTAEQMEAAYQQRWDQQFQGRLRAGRMIQRFFGNPFLSNLLLLALKPFPQLVDVIVRKTHGERF